MTRRYAPATHSIKTEHMNPYAPATHSIKTGHMNPYAPATHSIKTEHMNPPRFPPQPHRSQWLLTQHQTIPRRSPTQI
jgi:hypothetical protein